MARYHRVNIDGKSLFKTETRLVTAATLPGTFAVITPQADPSMEEFTPAPAGSKGRVYVMNAAEHQGLTIRQAIPAGNSGVGNYLEEGREFAILCVPGTYQKGTPIAVVAAGQGGVGTEANCVGYSQDTFTIAAGQTDFIRTRMRIGGVAAAA